MGSRRAFLQSASSAVAGLAGASRLLSMNPPPPTDRPTNSTPLPVITPERFVHSRTQSATHALRERDRLIDALEHAWISSIALSGFLLEGGFMTADSMDLDMPTRMMEQMGSMDRGSRVFDRPSDFR
jgi:hypothetical protein